MLFRSITQSYPRNVEVFRQLGMDMVINIPEMIEDMIGSYTTVKDSEG